VHRKARTAQDLAVIADENSSQASEGLTQAIVSLQPRLLRKYGIVTTLNEALGDLANSTDITAKRNRMLEFVLQEGEKVAGVYENALGLVGKKLGSMARLAEDAGAALGKHFLPTLTIGVDLLSKLLKWYEKLPDPVQKFIAQIILGTTAFAGLAATAGGVMIALPFLLSGFQALAGLFGVTATTLGGLVGGVLSTVAPVLLAIAAAVGALVAVGAVLVKAWKENWGGIRAAITQAWGEIQPRLAGLLALAKEWGQSIARNFKAIANAIHVLLIPVFRTLSTAVKSINWDSIFGTLGDALNVAGHTINAFLTTINKLLRGQGRKAFSGLEDAAIDGLTLVALVFDKHIKKALVWGWNLIVNVANGISKAAQSILTKVMTFVGNIIGRFLAPGSPPKEGPLSNIVKWGQGVMNTFLRAFGLADFGLMREAMAPIQGVLESALQAGDIDEAGFVDALGKAREHVAELIANFNKTGEISEPVLSKIAETLGEGSEEYVKFLRLQLEHKKALERLEGVQNQVAKAEAKGFVSKALKDKLKAAEAEANAAKDQVDWQAEYLSMQQESIDLQLRLVQTLENVAKAMEKIAAATGEGAGIGEAFAGVGAGGAEEGAGWFDNVKASLGQMTPEFEAMRSKVAAWWERTKAWIDLPLEQKLQDVAQYLTDVTGVDFAGFLETVTGLLEKIDKEGFVNVVKEWIGGGIQYIKDNWEGWAQTVAVFLMEIIENAKLALTLWISTIMMNFFAWVGEQRDTWGQWLKDKFDLAWNSLIQKLRGAIATYANNLKDWMRSVVLLFVAKVLEKIGEWVDGLKAVGAKIVEKIKTGLSEAWDLVSTISTFLKDTVAALLAEGASWIESIKSVGAAIVDNLWAGISAKKDWLYQKWLALLEWLRSKLPFSEPDRDSPLYGLGQSGKAMVENFARGIDFSPVQDALRVQLGQTRLALAGTSSNLGINVTQQFGDVVFPNVSDGRDALGVRRGLQQQALEASMVGRTWQGV
jgi:hypothetical protein